MCPSADSPELGFGSWDRLGLSLLLHFLFSDGVLLFFILSLLVLLLLLSLSKAMCLFVSVRTCTG